MREDVAVKRFDSWIYFVPNFLLLLYRGFQEIIINSKKYKILKCLIETP